MFRVKVTTREGSGRLIFNFPHSSLLAEKGKTIFGRRGCHTKKQRNYPSFCGILTNFQCNFTDPWCRFIATGRALQQCSPPLLPSTELPKCNWIKRVIVGAENLQPLPD